MRPVGFPRPLLTAGLLSLMVGSPGVWAAGEAAAYGFGEGAGTTTADASGNASTGTIVGATWTTAGKNGNALSFDGVGDRITIADKNTLDLIGDITVSAWINPSNLTGYRDIVVKGAGAASNNYYLETLGNQITFGFYAGGWREHVTTTANLVAGTWYHVAAVFNNTANTVTIYLNGVAILTEAETGTPVANTSALTLGFGFGGEDFAGRIDDVRLYGRALTAAEVQTDLATGIGGTTPPDTTLPAVSVSAPAAGATVTGTVTVSATASDNVGVAGVQFFLDGLALGAEDTAAPYSVSWNSTTAANGAHTLTARARDAAGNQRTSIDVGVTVSNPTADTTLPTVSVSAPAAGATVTGTVPVSATASDNVGVVGVQFLLDGVALGTEDTTAPYSVSWNSATAANGAHTLTARARDAAGNQRTSTAISVTVANTAADTTAPTVSISAPAAGSTVSSTVSVTASAADNVGVAGVQFLLDGAPLGAEDTSAPYSASWNSATASNGSHTLTARARDAAGNQTISAAVGVNVQNALAGNNLVAGYAFNEGSGTATTDASGNANTGALSGTAWSAAGKNGAALSFNGAGSRVTVNASNSLDLTGDISVSAWINPSNLTGYRDVVVKGTGSASNNYYLETLGNQIVFGFYAGGWREHVTTNANLPLNTWSHIGAVFNNTADTVTIYLNGTAILTEAETAAPLANTSPLTLGFGFGGEDFAGLIDDVRIYSRALGAAEVSTDQSTGVGGTPAPDTTAPTVAVSAPAAGATVTGAVAVSATASDNVGVTGVQFLLDGAALGAEDTTAPYSVTWNSATAANGAHSLTARARDAAGNQRTSTAVSVTVSNAVTDATPPTVSVSAPAAGSTLASTVTVSASASDNVGVAGVQFLLDGTVLGAEDTTSPYSVSWNTATASNGAHSLTARARDAAGNQTTSTAVGVTVSNAAPNTSQDWPMVAGNSQRTGYSTDATINTTNANRLALAWSIPVNGSVSAQVLYAKGVTIAGTERNLLIAVTSGNTVYAIDAITGAQIWTRTFPIVTGACLKEGAEGIRSAPVIDRATNRIYVAPSDGKLYTISLLDGTNAASPLTLIDLPITNKIRGGLNLVGSNLYIASGSGGCDVQPWRGRIFRVDVSSVPTLAQTFDVIPGIPGDNRGGGIWGFGGVSADPATGNVYAATGSDVNVGRTPYGRRMLALSGNPMAVLGSYEAPPFAGPIPCDGAPCDLDFGSTPLVFTPLGCPTLALAGNKNGEVYLFRSADLAASTAPLQTINLNIVHDWLGNGGVGGIPAYSPDTRMVYVTDAGPGLTGISAGVVALRVLPAPACTLEVAWSKQLTQNGIAKSSPTVTAGGVVFMGEGGTGLVHAYNAATGVELWNSGTRVPDTVWGAPTAAGGRLYVGSFNGGSSGFVHSFIVP